MPTVSLTVTETPVDIVAGLGLVSGATYALQVQGSTAIALHWADTTPVTTPAPAITRLIPEETLIVSIGAEPIWAWVPAGNMDRISASQLRVSLGPPRHIETVDVSTSDYVRPQGFVLQVNEAGTVAYTTLDGGTTSRSETFTGAGFVSVAGVPVLLHTVHQTGTSPSTLSMTAGLL